MDVTETDGKVDRKHDEDDVRLDVGQGTQAVVLLLPCSVPQRELHEFSVKGHLCDIVFEYGWNVRLITEL